jgi:hypothetical protein
VAFKLQQNNGNIFVEWVSNVVFFTKSQSNPCIVPKYSPASSGARFSVTMLSARKNTLEKTLILPPETIAVLFTI